MSAAAFGPSAGTINRLRILEHGLDRFPAIILEPQKKAAFASGVARDASQLLDDHENGVVVAIEADFLDLLDVSGLLALAPQPVSRARPVMHLARLGGEVEGFAVHPGERQHLAAVAVLRDRRHEAVGLPFHCVEPCAHWCTPTLAAAAAALPPEADCS